jgi:dihydrofolate synthase/folylpolyglutamate synthase
MCRRVRVRACAAAIAALRLLGHTSRHTLAAALTDAHWPARLQRLTTGPLPTAIHAHEGGTHEGCRQVWLDGGHNPAAGIALAAALTGLTSHTSHTSHTDTTPDATAPLTTVFICGMLRSKDVGGFLSPLRPLGGTLYALPIPSEGGAAYTAAEMAAAAVDLGFEAYEAATPLDAVRAAAARSCAAPRLRIVICGSLYLAGWVLAQQREAALQPHPAEQPPPTHASASRL